jgi:hypothetical protein
MRILTAFAFNVIAGVAIAGATGLGVMPVIGTGMVVSLLAAPETGVLNMAIQKEVWINTIREGLFADNSFLTKAINASMFVDAGKTVHVPNAGSPSNVTKNRTTFPATVTTRTDVDLTFDLDEYTTDPIRIPHAETVELSYDKRESVIRTDRNKLREVIASSFLARWSPSSAGNIIPTTGDPVVAHSPAATGNRRAFVVDDVEAAMVRFNEDDVPQEGRYLLLDARMHWQLIKSMTKEEAMAFHAELDKKNGVIGKLFSFNVMLRSKALRYTGTGTPKDWGTGGAATDRAGALAWHQDSVCAAIGEIEMFESEGDPLYYSDIYSFLVRAGGRPTRADVKGLLAIVQDTVAAG